MSVQGGSAGLQLTPAPVRGVEGPSQAPRGRQSPELLCQTQNLQEARAGADPGWVEEHEPWSILQDGSQPRLLPLELTACALHLHPLGLTAGPVPC